jgi:hypothetical protein
MDHEAHLSDLRARKSWFFFDDEVVALGAGITTSSNNPHPIETIVENRLLGTPGNTSTPTLRVNGVLQSSATGWSMNQPNVSWVHLRNPMQATYGNADVGYFFPEPVQLRGKRESRSGRWSDINEPFGGNSLIQRTWLTLWLDHGERLTSPGASYAWVTLPGKSQAQTATYAANPDIEILSNTTAVQAVRDKRLGATGLNFWNHSTAPVAGFSSDRRASLTVLHRDGSLHAGLADPTQENSGHITVELPWHAAAVAEKDPEITVLQLTPVIRLRANVHHTRGRGLSVAFDAAHEVALDWAAFPRIYFSDVERADPSLAGPAGDGSGDGLSNFLVHALGLDPRLRHPRPVSTATVDEGGLRLALDFTRASAASDVVLEVQTSENLTDWTPIARSSGGAPFVNLGGARQVSESGSHPTRVTVVDGQAVSSSARRFLRLTATSP